MIPWSKQWKDEELPECCSSEILEQHLEERKHSSLLQVSRMICTGQKLLCVAINDWDRSASSLSQKYMIPQNHENADSLSQGKNDWQLFTACNQWCLSYAHQKKKKVALLAFWAMKCDAPNSAWISLIDQVLGNTVKICTFTVFCSSFELNWPLSLF